MIRELPGGRYEVKVYAGRDPFTGRERRISRTVHGSKRKARDTERDLIRQIRDQAPTAEVTVGQMLDRWLEVAELEDSTRYQTKRVVESRIKPALGARPLELLTPAVLDGYYAQLKRTLAPATVQRTHGIIRAACEAAVRWEWIPRNPATRARPPEAQAREPEPPSVDEVRKLLRVEDREMAVFLRLLVATGLRRGEACALRRSDVDLEVGVVRKARALGQAEGAPYPKGTKTGVRHQVAVDGATRDILGAYLAFMEDRARALDTELVADHFWFSDEADGSRSWRPDVVSHRYARLRTSLGLKVKLKDLRHFHATQLLGAGTDVYAVARRLAHARPSTTLNHYAGFVPAADQAAAETIGRVLDG